MFKFHYFSQFFIASAVFTFFIFCGEENSTSENRPDLHDQTITAAPQWARESVLYEIFPRVFTEEGTFKALESRLDYIQDLGVGILWLMPIFPVGGISQREAVGSPYAIKDFRGINPACGDEQDLHDLVDATHQRGMKIILGIVPGYAANDNILIKEHPDWFSKNKEGEFTPEWNDGNDVTNFNYDNPAMRRYMEETLIYWIRKFDIDGYCCNMTGTVSLDFWRSALSKLREIKSDIYLLAGGQDPQLLPAGFNSVYGRAEYNELLAIRRCKDRTVGIITLEREKRKKFPANSLIVHFLENQDEPRSMSTFGPQAIQAYASLLFTFPGIPLMYAGQEIGERQRPSLVEKSVINWQQQDTTLLELYRNLIRLRKNWACFTSGEFIQLPTASISGSVGAFLRLNQDSAAVVLINLKSKTAEKILITLPDGLPQNLMHFKWTGYEQPVTSFDINYMYFPELEPYTTRIFLGINENSGI